jgi:hypothetical protein
MPPQQCHRLLNLRVEGFGLGGHFLILVVMWRD